MNSNTVALGVIACLATATACLAAVPATVVETEVELKTYPFFDPDPVPATEKTRYPYFFIDGTSAVGTPRRWKAVVLENDKVKVTILPEIGGKVWGAVDKVSGREFIYYNHVVKFRNISQRGPWCSGGIEFNFGLLGHGPWTATPVSYFVRRNADGSASCFVSDEELATRTVWQVEVNLPAEAEGFLTRTVWYNASGFPTAYYHWMNAAYTVRGNPTFEYPGRAYIGHDGKSHAWPVDPDGHDLHVFAENAFGLAKSEHVVQGDNGFYGIWWKDWGVGSAHLNHVTQKYGRKVWLWPLSRAGAIWEDLLTDEDGQYTELQSGRVFNQPQVTSYLTPFKHPSFAPGVTDTFEEEWRVVRDRAFFDRAWDEKNYSDRPQRLPDDFDWNSLYGHFILGEQHLNQKFERKGEEELLKALELDRHYAPALDRLALLAARRGDYAKARAYAARALSLDTYDAAANYADGLALFAAGDFHRACERLGLAAYSPVYRAAAFVQVARAELAQRRWKTADEMADKALQADALNRDAKLVRIVAARKLGDAPRAKALAEALLATLPLCHGARYELNLVDAASEPFAKYVRNELAHEAYLSLGTWYAEAGLFEDAERVFARAAELTIVGTVLRAHALHRLGKADEAAATLTAAAAQSVRFAFPSRRETLPALDWAVASDGSWKFRYLRGVLLASFARDAEADADLDACAASPDDPVFYLYRATRRQDDAKLADLRRAAKLGGDWRVGLALGAYFMAGKDASSALRELKPYLAAGANKINIAYANALVADRRYRETVEFLDKTTFLPSEHGDNAAGAWVCAWRHLAELALEKGDERAAEDAVAKAVSFPERLGVGRPYQLNFKPDQDGRNPFADWPERLRAMAEKAFASPAAK